MLNYAHDKFSENNTSFLRKDCSKFLKLDCWEIRGKQLEFTNITRILPTPETGETEFSFLFDEKWINDFCNYILVI